MYTAAVVVLAAFTGGAVSATNLQTVNASPSAGDPVQGRALVRSFGCGACHVIPGISEADGIVGPPLDRIAERAYLAGVLANTHENMVRWLRDPPAVDPATAMPKVEMSEDQALHIAAFLYTLR
ncbi:c-type cytochrome [Methylolobus aquaticus]